MRDGKEVSDADLKWFRSYQDAKQVAGRPTEASAPDEDNSETPDIDDADDAPDAPEDSDGTPSRPTLTPRRSKRLERLLAVARHYRILRRSHRLA